MATKSPETTFQASKMSEVDQLTAKLAGTVLQQDVPFCTLCKKHKVPCTECKIEWTCAAMCSRCDNFAELTRYQVEDGQTRRWNRTKEQFVVKITDDGLVMIGNQNWFGSIISTYSTLVVAERTTTTSMET